MLNPGDARVVRHVLERPGIVRSALAEALDLSAAGAAVMIRGLVRQGVLVEAGRAPSGGGRRAAQLFVRPELAHAHAHTVEPGCLRSGVVNLAGEVVASTEATLEGAGGFPEAVERNSERLGRAVKRARVVAVVVTAPGLPEPNAPASFRVPWLFGVRPLDVSSVPSANGAVCLCSNAEALLRAEAAVDPAMYEERALAVDLCGGATAYAAWPGAGGLALDLAAFRPAPETMLRAALERKVVEASAEPESDLGPRLKDTADAIEALAAAEAEGDPTAAGVVDALTDAIAELLAGVVRLVRPSRVLLSCWAVAAGLCSEDAVRRRVRRLCPPGVAEAMSLQFAEPDVWRPAVGAGLLALGRWLEALESGR
ncbi:MAG: MarR family transcriptional regulator [Armatimonadetes bacterium]|nr:MarR family transcriptional regulator [Armatimonadota bacterium]